MSANNSERADKTEGVRKNIAVGSDHQPETAVNHTPKTSLFEVSYIRACYGSSMTGHHESSWTPADERLQPSGFKLSGHTSNAQDCRNCCLTTRRRPSSAPAIYRRL